MSNMSTLQKSLFKSGLPPRAPGSTGSLSSNSSRMAGRKRDYTPVSFSKYFEKFEDIEVNGNSFRIYRLGSDGPVLFLLHGGGFSALSWSLFAAHVTSMARCQVLAMDIRGHGNSHTDNDEDLSALTLAKDVGDVVQAIFANCGHIPPIVLMGHSMGGAVAVRAAAEGLVPSLEGLAVIDVVEGTAMDALNSMQSFLRGRPKNFRTLEHAIEWCIRTGQIRNIDSAKVSMPGQLKNTKTGELATADIDDGLQTSTSESSYTSVFKEPLPNTIQEEDEATLSSGSFKAPVTSGAVGQVETQGLYTWRIDLGQTEKHWSGWFQGLSSSFLSVSCPKMLLLAGIDRLDRELTVGQMQGKFQMQVMPQCGHAVHEDVPDKVAEVVASFLVRYKLAEPVTGFQSAPPGC